jgi:hypothetical protein
MNVFNFESNGIKKLISKAKTDNNIDPKMISNKGEVL